MSGENIFTGLTEEHGGDARWAFGTGFTEALAGVDTTLPEGVDGADLAAYCQMLGDDALIQSQRLIHWVTDAPELEEEVALANIALDLLGQARLLLARAGQADGTGRDEDAFAYRRPAAEFRNVCLTEIPRGDFARCVTTLLVLSTWRLALFTRLADSRDPVLAAIAAKGVNELAYHREYAVSWALRLGDGTPYSNERMREAVADVWPRTGELFATHPVEAALADRGAGVDPASVREEVRGVLDQVLTTATLPAPGDFPEAGVAGRDGRHTGELAPLLEELQRVAREHPEATW
ncbi:phenylacetate-CoA oxygenase subunit PaaI [Nocardiopsis terrae]|uniref:Ring-1,2-phenylacetyl-CoA epoxidase subunit PaaC n=1 Tax=Nocardiopsis terrae TaxID=372655 RepID=A0ABR9HG43_9ACTN|nr:1,2-phenylacetyl-CoA epoxidase subunit PaaC [Nocardiopsis terrae]MBE1458003.1 ring-1,2-phenylacetyl-CoA epoxidase subunit PaaC [Nocardiopsis terrae]GHC83089.1 phenylacetate-CoA oxygenase subunit PaaI [Nocardiopsis terrae]